MSFLKKLFGGKSPIERLARGERLVAEGELGLACLELEGALANPGLSADEIARARAALSAARESLARGHLEEASALLEAGEVEPARERIALARGLAEDTATREELAALDGRARSGPAVASARGGEEAPADDEPEDEAPEDEEEPAGEPDEDGPEGDDMLSPFEVFLHAQSEPEADRFRALAAVEPGLAEGLGLLQEGDAQAALERLAAVREPAASDRLVRRERARALLMAGEAAPAAALLDDLEAGQPGEAGVLELLLEARTTLGPAEAVAACARSLLDTGQARDPEAAISALAAAGHAEEGLRHLDLALDAMPRDVRLWELRGSICAGAGSPEGAAQADARALALHGETVSRSDRHAHFPLASARRQSEALGVEGLALSGPALDRALVLVRQLATHDREQRRRWRGLLRRLGG